MQVVIGSGTGMGAAVAALLDDRGPVLRADRSPSDGVVSCDITNQADVDALVESAGAWTTLVVTAGLSPSMADGRSIYEVNLLGMDRVLTAFEATMQPGSVALCFSSNSAHMMPVPDDAAPILDHPESPTFYDDLAATGVDVDEPTMAYILSKQAVQRLVRRRATPWGARGARILSLSPGIIDTGMGRLEASKQPIMADMVELSAMHREGTAEEVAAVAAFLVSDGASFMTGTDVLVDGGIIASMTMPPEPEPSNENAPT